ncbi:hypothetical protein LIER_29728 [Lithospermum erythrorhizon]|uniref:DUF4283 domain-containing protein n=1 Tax=Lithospermum erythrorhizon TaxID=34254 RepID=A0AAV3RK69_LITER
MAGDEAGYRPPPNGGGPALPPEPGGPMFTQTATNISKNPNSPIDLAHYMPVPAAAPVQHVPAAALPPPTHSTQSLGQIPQPSGLVQPESQALAPSKTSIPTSAISLHPINPTAPSPAQAPASAAPVPAAQAPAAQAPAAQHPAAQAFAAPAAPALSLASPAIRLVAPSAHGHPGHSAATAQAPAELAPAPQLAHAPQPGPVHVAQAHPPNLMHAAPTTSMHKPSYAHAALGLTSVCTADDPQARPCLDSHNLKPVGIHDGKPSIRFKKADKLRFLGLMKHVLVGKFSHCRPTIAIIKEFFIALKLKGAYNISLYDAKHLIIECDLLEDYTRFWESALTPVWVHFPGLPIFLYEEEGLLSVANSIGKPLRIDALNTNRVKLGVASVCVELDVSKPLVDKVWVSFEDDECADNNEGFWQQVQYDEIPHYCSKCFDMGHSVENCKRDFEKERMQAEKGKMEMGSKPTYVKRRNLRREYNPKDAQSSKTPKPADNVASTSASAPKNNDASTLASAPKNNNDFVKFPKPSVRRGDTIQKWIARLSQKRTPSQEVVLTKNPFASLSVDQDETQPDEPDLTTDPKGVDNYSAASLLSDPTNPTDVGVDLPGSEVLQSGEIVDQSGDTKVEIATIDLEEINVTYHVESAPSSPTDPKRFDNNISFEDVAPVANQALDDALVEQLIDSSLHPIPNDVENSMLEPEGDW